MMWQLVEPCCGTAALTMTLLGAKRQLVPRQGSKWQFRKELVGIVRSLGFTGAPNAITLSDTAPWGLCLETALSRRDALIGEVRSLVTAGEADPAGVHRRLAGSTVPADRLRMAAELLWLQRMAYAGKAVRVVDGRWASPGLNQTSAYGVGATAIFGEVKPLGPALMRVLASLPQVQVGGHVGTAEPPGDSDGLPTLVYIDPPYRGRTGYGANDISRSEVVALAQRWAASGATVIVSEAGPIAELGWPYARLGELNGTTPATCFRAKHRNEFVTWRRGEM